MFFDTALAEEIWSAKYRFASPGGEGDSDYAATIARVAGAVAGAEKAKIRGLWRDRFAEALTDFRFIPGGRVLPAPAPVVR